MRTVVLALLLLMLAGCGLRPVRPAAGLKRALSPEACNKLAREAELEHVFAILCSGGGTAGAGLAPAIDNEIARDSILGVAGALGLVGAVLEYTGGLAAARYSKECP